MSQTTAEKLYTIVDRLGALVTEGEQIFVKVGGSTVGEIERVGEMKHLENIMSQGGELWCSSLPFAAVVCHKKRIKNKELRQAYAKDGICSERQAGAFDVAGSIIHGENKGFVDYYPINHLKGMLSALCYVLEKE